MSRALSLIESAVPVMVTSFSKPCVIFLCERAVCVRSATTHNNVTETAAEI